MSKDQSSENKKKLSKEAIKKASRIFTFLKPYFGSFTLGFVFLILSSLTAMLFPYLLGKLIGNDGETARNAFTSVPLDNVKQIITALFAVFITQAIFSFFRIVLFAKVTENTLRDIRDSAFKKLVSSPISFFNKNKVGELTSRLATDINLLQTTFNTTIAEFIRQLITIIVGVAALLWLSPKLSLIMLAVIPVVAVLAVVFGRYIRGLSKKAQNSAAKSNNILEETLSGIQNVKAFANEFFEIAKYQNAINEIKDLSIKGALWRGAFVSFIILCMFGSIVFIIWQGVLLMQEGNMLQSDFIAFIMYTIFLGASIGSLPDLYSGIQKAIGATENLMEIMDEAPEPITIDRKVAPANKIKGDVSFKNVSFVYETRQEIEVLKSIDFSVKAGEQIALVGPSGAGKSTIVSLLLRFYKPGSGKILIDNKDSADYDLSEYRSQLALVPQEVILFNGSIRENIMYGNTDASEAEIIEAADKANAIEFIEKFPEGMDTLVGERGVQLSGGQRQRIAIARAVLRDPRILILDEATSSLDSESERLVQEALVKLMKGRTSFVIAHRLSTIKNADKILVMKDGEIAETGSHTELMASETGLYKKLQELQNLHVEV